MMTEQSLLQEHEVLFLDFLGFAAAVRHWDDARLGQVIEAIVALAKGQSEFDLRGEALPDGGYKITSPAAITTFSDHIVVSYPQLIKPADFTDAQWELVAGPWPGMVRQQMQKITAQIAMAGLDVGLLVRGGLSRGKLYHRGRVVLGEAMVDAYRLESEVAQYPRVVVSPRITDDDRLFSDVDGTRCLDYLDEMMLLAEERHGDARAWVQAQLAQIRTYIGALEQRQAKKWIYFKDRLLDTLATLALLLTLSAILLSSAVAEAPPIDSAQEMLRPRSRKGSGVTDRGSIRSPGSAGRGTVESRSV
jgi:hypothetical protein